MKESSLVAAQLQKRDPAAWSALLREQLGIDDLVVTAVSGKPLRFPANNGRITRYLLALKDHADPIPFIGKRATPTEIAFYRQFAPQLEGLAPRCRFIHQPDKNKIGWLVLEDVPNDITPDKWTINDVEAIISRLADLHAWSWQHHTLQANNCFPHFIGDEPLNMDELWAEDPDLFEEGPAAILSEHALSHAGRLARPLVKAANGLAVMRALGGWPGIISETHLTIAADLLDDPVPMLEPIRHLPYSLLHGSSHSYHWHLTLFDDLYLLDWQHAVAGPGVLDLVNFLEQFELLYENGDRCKMNMRPFWPVSEETMVDTYFIAMKARLGNQFHGRAVRQAIPAARCLYVLTNWFTTFAEWFDDMPDLFTWQKINRLPDEELAGTVYEPVVRLRPYLRGVFARFLQSYRSL